MKARASARVPSLDNLHELLMDDAWKVCDLWAWECSIRAAPTHGTLPNGGRLSHGPHS